MIPLTNNSTTPMKRQKSVTFAKKGSNIKCINDEHCRKVKDHCHYTGQYRGAAYAIQEIVQLKKSCGFHNGLNYDYHFAVKELTKKFEGKLNCLRENTVSNNNKKKLKELVKMEKKLQKTYECYLSALVNIKTLKII